MASLAVTPVRRLHPKLANLIRFRRLLGLYAFFYATLHLATYVFLFSGYDLPTVWAGLKSRPSGRDHRPVEAGVADDSGRPEEAAVHPGGAVWMGAAAAAGGDVSCVCDAAGWAARPGGGCTGWCMWRRAPECVHYWWLVKKGVKAPLPFTLVLAALLLARVVWSVRNRRRKARCGRRQLLRLHRRGGLGCPRVGSSASRAT